MARRSKNTHATAPKPPDGPPKIDLSGNDLPVGYELPLYMRSLHGDVQHFLDLLARKRYIEIVHRGIVSGRRIRVDDDFYHQYYLPYIQFQGWEPILNLNERVFPALVKLFYANLRVERNNNDEIVSVVSMVKGVRIRLTLEDIAKALAISSSGDKVFFTSHESLFQHVADVNEYYRAFTCHETNPYRGLKGMDILPEFQLLRHFLSFSLSPPKEGGHRDHFDSFPGFFGHRDDVDIMQGFILNSLVVKRRICLPYIIVFTMEHTVKQTTTKPSLPYGSIITKLLLAAGIDLCMYDIPKEMDKPLEKKAIDELMGFTPHWSQWMPFSSQGASSPYFPCHRVVPPSLQGASSPYIQDHRAASPPPKRVRTEEGKGGGSQLDRIERELGLLRAEMTTFFEEVQKTVSTINKEVKDKSSDIN